MLDPEREDTENENQPDPETPEEGAEETPEEGAALETPEEETPDEGGKKGEAELENLVNRIAGKIRESSSAGKQADTTTDVREAIKEQMGWTDAQVDTNQALIAAATADLHKKIVWQDIQSQHPDAKDLKAEVDKELSRYPKSSLVQPGLIESVFFMVRGRNMKQGKTTPAPTPRVAKTYNGGGFANGSDSGMAPQTPALSKEEKSMARAFGMTDADYNRYKKNAPVESFRKK